MRVHQKKELSGKSLQKEIAMGWEFTMRKRAMGRQFTMKKKQWGESSPLERAMG